MENLDNIVMFKFAIKILWDCPWESTVPTEGPHIPLSIPDPSYLSVEWNRWDCPCESTVPIEGPHIPLSILSHHGTVHGSLLFLLRGLISHCPFYPTVQWERWDCPWESTKPSEGLHIPLSIPSHCTMEQVGLSMGVHYTI